MSFHLIHANIAVHYPSSSDDFVLLQSLSVSLSIFSGYQLSKRQLLLGLLLKYIDCLFSRQKRKGGFQYCIAAVSSVIQDWEMETNREHLCRW